MENRLFSIVCRLRRVLAATRRLDALCAALVLALALSACATGKGGSGPGGTMLSGESAARMANASEIVFVVPPDGMPLQTSLVLADAIAAEIRDSDHPAILARAPNQAGASVVGAVASALEAASAAARAASDSTATLAAAAGGGDGGAGRGLPGAVVGRARCRGVDGPWWTLEEEAGPRGGADRPDPLVALVLADASRGHSAAGRALAAAGRAATSAAAAARATP